MPQQIAGGEIYPALEKGTLDACEWVGPYDDEKLGLEVPRLLLPGLVGRRADAPPLVNLDKWNSLTPAYKSLVKTASSMANEWMQAKYDAGNPAALKRLVAGGALLRPFSQPTMDASLKAALELYAETSKTNADFKKVFDAMLAFRNDQYLWWQVAELSYDTYLFAIAAAFDRCDADAIRARPYWIFGGSPKSSGGGKSGCWISILTLDGSTPVARESQ